jgi:hypothetical protein
VAGLPELQEIGAEEITEHKIEEAVPGDDASSTLRGVAKGAAAGAVVAGAAAAAKVLADRAGSTDGDREDEE